jgi:TusA-related sulfurtransferase
VPADLINYAVMEREAVRLDLRGVKCPLNWAHAKVRLERMKRGQILELILDDPRGARDIPRAAEGEGYSILASENLDGGVFRLRIEK